MKTFLLGSAILAVASAAAAGFNLDFFFEEFKATHSKAYGSSSEELLRRQVFTNNYHAVEKHNKEAAAGLHSYTRTWNNQFADATPSEIAVHMGYRPDANKNKYRNESHTFLAPVNVDLPTEVDWRKHGAVTEVKNQGPCGSCWAFSATGTLEGMYFLKTGKLVSLSEQQLIDCNHMYENDGCDGGNPKGALWYIMHNKGIDTEESYPYLARDDKCHFMPDKIGATDRSFGMVTRGDEKDLMAAVATKGPISVSIYADSYGPFASYKSGVYSNRLCVNKFDDLNHSVLLVGYGYDEATGLYYWLVKNSWGPEWGEEGYIRMVRNEHNQCGVATDAVYAEV